MGMKPAILQLGNSINERKEKMDAIKLNLVYDDLRQYIFFISIQISIQIIIFDRKTNCLLMKMQLKDLLNVIYVSWEKDIICGK